MAERPLLGWLWRDHLRRHWPAIAIAFVLMGLEGAMMGALSWLIRPLFDTVFLGSDRSLVPLVALAIAGVFLLRALAGFGHSLIMARHSESVSASVQNQVLGHVLHLDLPFFQTHPPGQLIERIRGDASAFRVQWQPILTAIGRDIVGLLCLIGVALWTDWRWTLIAVIGAPLLSWPLARLQDRVNRTAHGARAAAAQLSTRLDEIFHGLTTIRLTGQEAHEAGRYAADLDRFRQGQFRSDSASAAIPALIDVVAAIGFGGVMVYGGYQIMDGAKTVGEFMSFFLAMALIFEPLRRLGAVSGQWAQARAALERLRQLLDETPRITAPAQPLDLPGGWARGGLTLDFEDVHFAYGAQPVLRGLTFSTRPGEVTAIIGPSGAGKTTILALASRLVDPAQGSIRIQGQDIRQFDPRALRHLFAVVGQDNALFDETIRDNIAMGRPGLSEADLNEALAAAEAAQFVAALPLGAETPAGPRGSALSGGQRQRIAIARALARKAPFLLLDEATSALDAATEDALSASLAQPQPQRTTLVIAHKLATVRQADQILVLDRGTLVQRGRHDDLLAQGGLYATLHALQFKEV